MLEMGGRVAEKEKLFTGCDARSPCVQSMSDTNIYLKEIFHVWQFSELISEPFYVLCLMLINVIIMAFQFGKKIMK